MKRYLLLSGIVFNIGLVVIVLYGSSFLFRKDFDLTNVTTYIANHLVNHFPSVAAKIRNIGSTEFVVNALAPRRLDEWHGRGADADRILPDVAYSSKGVAVSIDDSRAIKLAHGNKVSTEVLVSTPKELIKAINRALPGDKIVLQDGVYSFKAKRIDVKRPGSMSRPIYVMARKLGGVQLEFNMVEGFYVDAPFWVFQNLKIKGICERDSRCEHAFHIVGKAEGTVIRNNIITDFNAQIKGNGTRSNNQGFQYPDFVSIESNSFYNHHIRDTDNPVTELDLVAVNNWMVEGNLIADFYKGRGDKVSYAAFFKGNGSDNIFQRNLVICQANLYQQKGARVGLSFGGGGTGVRNCRHQECPVEHTNGILRDNVIMDCDDVGVYLNKSKNTKVYNNTLVNTLGIDVRFKQSDAMIFNNILTGRIKNRNGGKSSVNRNIITDLKGVNEIFKNPLHGDFELKNASSVVGKGEHLATIDKDFCSLKRDPLKVDIGAFQYIGNKTACLPFDPSQETRQ